MQLLLPLRTSQCASWALHLGQVAGILAIVACTALQHVDNIAADPTAINQLPSIPVLIPVDLWNKAQVLGRRA